jgi:hypothetical protein
MVVESNHLLSEIREPATGSPNLYGDGKPATAEFPTDRLMSAEALPTPSAKAKPSAKRAFVLNMNLS